MKVLGPLHQRADLRSLLFVFLTILLLLLPHIWHPEGLVAVLWIGIAVVACFSASIVSHNHLHCAVFSTPRLNLSLNIALSLARGHTASGVVVPHNCNHHPLAGSELDWIRPSLAGRGLGWFRLGRYVLAASANMLAQRRRSDAPVLPESLWLSARMERVALAAWISGLLISNWRVFLWFNALPWCLGLALLVGVNLLQHDHCDPACPLGDSRNFVGPVGNWFFFNNGFHTVHHLEPDLHWSQLPGRHAELRSHLPSADLEHRSVLRYLWRFGWSRH